MSAIAGQLSAYFLPYQARWLQDRARLKIVEKSRRVGFTYVQSYEDTLDAARAEKPIDVWFSSADESAAKEYILYVAQWARLLNLAATDLGETVISKEDNIKALTVQFATGKRINALTSNPRAFRSKGGKLVLDEFAFHSDQEAMWKAARPIITWGYPARILSTYNGKGNRYYRMVSDAKRALVEGRPPLWSLHTVTYELAVHEGLADRIAGRPLRHDERLAWIERERLECGDDDTWQQEFMCNPVDEASAWLPWELIVSAEHTEAGVIERLDRSGECFIGWDVARTQDKSVIWVSQRVGDVLWTRDVHVMKKQSFGAQLAAFDARMTLYNVRRACIDATGLGMPIVEEAQARWGQYRVEGVTFTGAVKQHMATHGKQQFEDRRVRIPVSREIRDSHHSVRKVTTAAGNPRFDADRNETGHADEFWAHMLALHAADSPTQPAAGETIEPDSEAMRPEGMRGRVHAPMFGDRLGGDLRPVRAEARRW